LALIRTGRNVRPFRKQNFLFLRKPVPLLLKILPNPI
jgi:hypothetical protein